MMRYSFQVSNLAVAGAALLRRVRQKRIVRVVAFHARFAGIMKHGDNLRESGRSGRIVTVTKGTISAFPWRAGNKFIRRLDMLRCRTMACLARNALMIGFLVKFIDLLVTVNTRLVAGIFYILVHHLVDGISSVMAISPE